MKRIVWTFGLIAGGILSVMMLATMPFIDQIGDKAEVLGYTTMVVAFLMVFFGIRTYRDNVLGGSIAFGKAFQVGILITVVASMCYVATWEVLFFEGPSNFGEKFSAKMMEKAKTSGGNRQQIDAEVARMKRFQELYRNPFINSAMTFVEPFPVGLVITLACAGILKRKRREPGASAAAERAVTAM